MENTMKVNRKFQHGMALRMALQRQKMPNSGAIATFLLESFLENDGRLLASTVYARGLCDEKQFRDWRKNLIDKQWIIWCETQTDKGVYFPGKKLMPYINKEKIAQKEIATRESVEKVRSDLDSKIEKKADRSELLETKQKLDITSKELQETKSKLEDTNRVVAKIAKAVRKLQQAKVPPIDDEKLAMQEQAAQELEEHTRALVN
jgi:hypothetical protein